MHLCWKRSMAITHGRAALAYIIIVIIDSLCCTWYSSFLPSIHIFTAVHRHRRRHSPSILIQSRSLLINPNARDPDPDPDPAPAQTHSCVQPDFSSITSVAVQSNHRPILFAAETKSEAGKRTISRKKKKKPHRVEAFLALTFGQSSGIGREKGGVVEESHPSTAPLVFKKKRREEKPRMGL